MRRRWSAAQTAHAGRHCYQLLAQLCAVKSMLLLLPRDYLRAEDVQEPLQAATARLEGRVPLSAA